MDAANHYTTRQTELKLPASLSCLAPLLAFTREYASGMGFGEQDVYHLQLALEETVVNVIQHGYANNEQEHFDVHFIQSPPGITIVIREKGLPFDPDTINRSQVDFSGNERQGLGLYLIRKVLDKVEYLNLGRQGKEIRLTKYLPSRMLPVDSDSISSAINIAPPAAPREFSVKIRPFSDSDALGISRCAYLSYGYTYEEFIYLPERIIEANRNGLLYSIVAVEEESGLVIGHIALKFKTPDALIAERGVAFVHPEFRGAGTLGLLMEYAVDYARQVGLAGIYVHSVTSHVLSQRKAGKGGFLPCGIMLGMYPGDVNFKGLSGQVAQRISALLCYKRIGDHPLVAIYPPAKHLQQIAALYRSLDIDAKCLDARTIEMPKPIQDMLIHTAHDAVINSAHIEIVHYGHDQQTLCEVQLYLRRFCIDKADVIFLHLDLTAPQTGLLAEEFEKMGFFFSGILPGGKTGKETLILQYLNNLKLDYNQIALYSEEAKALLDYVRMENVVQKQ